MQGTKWGKPQDTYVFPNKVVWITWQCLRKIFMRTQPASMMWINVVQFAHIL